MLLRLPLKLRTASHCQGPDAVKWKLAESMSMVCSLWLVKINSNNKKSAGNWKNTFAKKRKTNTVWILGNQFRSWIEFPILPYCNRISVILHHYNFPSWADDSGYNCPNTHTYYHHITSTPNPSRKVIFIQCMMHKPSFVTTSYSIIGPECILCYLS